MAFTQYTQSTDIILNLGKDPEDRPDLDDDGLAHKFDQNSENIVTWINETHLPEVDAVKEDKEITYVTVTASRTLTSDDLYKWILATHATVPIVLTMPAGLTTKKGWIVVEQGGAAQASVAAGAGVTYKPSIKLKVGAQDEALVLTHKGSDVWGVGGSKKA